MLCAFLGSAILFALASEAQTTATAQSTTLSPQETKCYRLRADKQVSIYGLDEAGTSPPSETAKTLPASVVADPILRMKFQAQHGFDDVDGDGVERFRFTVICRCHNETNTLVHHIQKAHLGEVDCKGNLSGGRIEYDLGIDKIGQCFVASQRQTRAGAGNNLSRFFLELSPNVTLEASQAALDPTKAYFKAGDFKVHRYTYHDVCTQDLGMPRGDFVPIALRGSAVKLRPFTSDDDNAKYVKVAYEGSYVAKTIAVA